MTLTIATAQRRAVTCAELCLTRLIKGTRPPPNNVFLTDSFFVSHVQGTLRRNGVNGSCILAQISTDRLSVQSLHVSRFRREIKTPRDEGFANSE